MPLILDFIQKRFRGSDEDRIHRKTKLYSALYGWIPYLRLLLLLIGFAWFLLLPSPQLGRGTYIDENALQPAQVHTYWNWDNVKQADQYLADLELLVQRNASHEDRADTLKVFLQKSGLKAYTQPYRYDSSGGPIAGTNVYAVLSAPRASGVEAMVISASWLSRMTLEDGSNGLNLRGVCTVLTLASFLKRKSLWAKDIVFVVGDGHLEGIHAWLSAYHQTPQPNLHTVPLNISTSVVWTALNIDYPGHSFSHLGIFHEGLNGRLPNQDLINTVEHVARFTSHIPVILYDHIDPRSNRQWDFLPRWLRTVIDDNPELMEYAVRARNLIRHMSYQALGKPSGVHGLYHRYRIDAVTLFAFPAVGPHGFHSLGGLIESSLRSMNNLLERLHASFFFYILTTPTTFLKVGTYLPPVILISVALMFGGLRTWVSAGWIPVNRFTPEKGGPPTTQWERRRRPVIAPIALMAATHVISAIILFAIKRNWPLLPGSLKEALTFPAFQILLGLGAVALRSIEFLQPHAVFHVLGAFNLCLASTIISVTAVLNFSLAALLSLLFGSLLSLVSLPIHGKARDVLFALHYVFSIAAFLHFVLPDGGTPQLLELYGGWFLPFWCLVYLPITLQASIASMSYTAS